MPSTMITSQQMHRALAFGLRWDSDVPLAHFEQAVADGAPADIVVRQVAAHHRMRKVVIEFGGAALCSDGVRLTVEREAVFDTIGTDLIEWSPSEAWTGTFPATFYRTLTALLLAWRGCIPIHGTAVDVDGRGVLICGASSAGKSTLGAGLIALGAKLISDDLSVLVPPENGGGGFLYAGCPAMRLFPRIASYLKTASPVRGVKAVIGDKDIVHPPRVASLATTPFDYLIVLDSNSAHVAPADQASLLHAQLFRPRWMANLPGYTTRGKKIVRVAKSLRVISLPALAVHDDRTFVAHASSVLERIRECRLSCENSLPVT